MKIRLRSALNWKVCCDVSSLHDPLAGTPRLVPLLLQSERGACNFGCLVILRTLHWDMLTGLKRLTVRLTISSRVESCSACQPGATQCRLWEALVLIPITVSSKYPFRERTTSNGIPDQRMGGGIPQRHHSVAEYDPLRSHSASNLQNFYATQRYQTRPSEAEQMMQAKRRMAAQRERELRNYHQEQQYNRSKPPWPRSHPNHR